MDTVITYLPPGDGFLPKWLLFVSVVSIGNSIQAYSSLGPTRKVYTGPTSDSKDSPVTALSARTFGTWTLLASVIRLYAAYNIENKQIYEIAFWSYAIAFGHFFTEWQVFGSTRMGKGLAGPVIVSTLTIAWMILQKDFYVK